MLCPGFKVGLKVGQLVPLRPGGNQAPHGVPPRQRAGENTRGGVVYRLNPVEPIELECSWIQLHPYVERAWHQTLEPEKVITRFQTLLAPQMQLAPLQLGGGRGRTRDGADGV
jgi:hypothetical protein